MAQASAEERVLVEEHEVGLLPLAGPERIDVSFDLPGELGTRTFVSVRLESSDYVLADPARGTCSAFLLERIELR